MIVFNVIAFEMKMRASWWTERDRTRAATKVLAVAINPNLSAEAGPYQISAAGFARKHPSARGKEVKVNRQSSGDKYGG